MAKRKGRVRENIESILIAVAIALVIRMFVIEAFKIPSGSMIPTLSVGDHIFVNKFVYGLRLPFTEGHFMKWHDPKRGDVVVFVFPIGRDKDYIKRVIGVPGDVIKIDNKNIYINDKKIERSPVDVEPDPSDRRRLLVKGSEYYNSIPFVPNWQDYDFFEETIGDSHHIVQYYKYAYRPKFTVEVPSDEYFVMGDNRDNSADSREWGFVPQGLVKGKAMFVWLPWDSDQGGVRWREFGRWIR